MHIKKFSLYKTLKLHIKCLDLYQCQGFLHLFSCIIYNVFLLCEVVSEQFRRKTHCIMPTYQCPYSYLSVIAPWDQYTFLGNCPPTPPLSQHFALSQRKPEGFKFPRGIRDPGHWNPGLGSKNPKSANDWKVESSTWNPEPTAWNPESQTLLDYLTRGDC